jgi:cysteine-rich repeat protein
VTRLFVAVFVVGCGGGGGDPIDPFAPDAEVTPPDAIDAPDGPPPGTSILDPAVLHDFAITMTAEALATFDEDQTMRVPCDVVADGTLLVRAGCRKKGGIGSVDLVIGKPAFSIQLDEYVAGQELDGLDRIVLNNAIQDPSLFHEHVSYDVFRRAGIPAHRTAFAQVTLNGEPKGIYVVCEPVDKEFLRDRFGADHDDGNLYEAAVEDFALDPAGLELKGDDDGASRADLEAAAAAVNDTPDASFAATVGALIDLDQFATFFAVELALAAEDGLVFGRNNYYMYHRPDTDRFVFLPHGQDVVMGNPALRVDYPPPLRLAARVHAIPALRATVDAALAAISGGGAAADPAAQAERIAAGIAVIRTTARDDDFTAGDLATMARHAPAFAAQLAWRAEVIAGTAAPAACGDGVVQGGEECDDGNALAGDGCDAACEPECFAASAHGASWRLCPARRDWAAQVATCAAEGGSLAVPTDAADAAAMASVVRRHLGSAEVWLGLTDAATENSWRTPDGGAAPYLGFAPGEPNGGGNEDCGALDLIYLRDRACDRDFAALCRMP